MASIEQTAYPRFRRVVSARELADLTPTEEDVAWARQRSRSDEHLLALVLSLSCFARLGYFPRSEDVSWAWSWRLYPADAADDTRGVGRWRRWSSRNNRAFDRSLALAGWLA